MKFSAIINSFHSLMVFYILFGWLLESQRNNLVLLLPTLQYQFLVNDNQCVLTQLEKRLLKDEKKEDTGYDSFIDKKLKEYNILITDKHRELMIHSFVYGSFLISYSL